MARRLIESLLKAADDHGVRLRLYCQPFAVPEANAESFAKTDLWSGREVIEQPERFEWMLAFYGSLGFKPAGGVTAKDIGLMTRD